MFVGEVSWNGPFIIAARGVSRTKREQTKEQNHPQAAFNRGDRDKDDDDDDDDDAGLTEAVVLVVIVEVVDADVVVVDGAVEDDILDDVDKSAIEFWQFEGDANAIDAASKEREEEEEEDEERK